MTGKAEKRIFTFLKREVGKEKSQIISSIPGKILEEIIQSLQTLGLEEQRR